MGVVVSDVVPLSYNKIGAAPTVADLIGRYDLNVHPCNSGLRNEERRMLKWALIFFLISLVAGVFGFTGIAAGTAGIAKVLFFLALFLFLVFLVLGVTVAKKVL